MITRAKISKSRRIADAMREEFRTLHAKKGTPTASASEIAEQFEVSVPTAHNAINLLVREGLLYRVRGSGTFFNSHPEDAVLRVGIGDSIIPDLSVGMQKIWNKHIEYALNSFSRFSCEARTFSYPELENMRSNGGLSRNFDALLITHNYLDPATIRTLLESGLPTVIYRGEIEYDIPFSQVCYDVNSGIDEAFHEISLSSSESPVIVVENTPNGNSAKQLYLKHLEKAGFKNEAVTLYEMPYQQHDIICFRLIRVHYKKFKGKFIFAGDDDLASILISALYDEGMIAGRDYRLVSIGNQEEYGYQLPDSDTPLIASVDLPKELMAQEACRLLLQIVRNRSLCRFIVKVPTHFVMRRSASYTTTVRTKGD